MPFFSVSELPGTEMLPGIVRRAVHLEHTMMTIFDFEPRSVVPEHDHPHEQITYVVQGSMEFTLGGETRILRAGEGACCPSGVSHGAVILDEPTIAVDAWYPVREEYA
jgi:quercetin dioxygenase-like cupin family protein